jgi:hypothetical protein
VIRATNLPDRYNELSSRFERERILSRIWAHDYTVWKADPAEITNRLGWLHAPFSMMRELDRLDAFAKGARANGFEHALLLGMGGSSLAPETFARTFGVAPGFLDLSVLDSTHPEAVAAVESRLDVTRTLFLVATKSGTTTETLSLFRYFYNNVREKEEAAEAGARFVAITDPGSPLAELAARHKFSEVFLNDPNFGALTLRPRPGRPPRDRCRGTPRSGAEDLDRMRNTRTTEREPRCPTRRDSRCLRGERAGQGDVRPFP